MDEILLEVKEYLRQNMGIYIFTAALFVIGILAGGLVVRGLEDTQHLALNQYFSLFVDSFSESPVMNQGEIFRQSLKVNFQYLFATWVLGIFIFGFPFICGLVLLRGFSVGFTVAFLVERASYKGALFAMGSVLPHNLIIIPVVIVIAVTGFSFSWLRFRSYLEKKPVPLREHVGPYTLAIFSVGTLLLLGILAEAYISPIFVRLLIPMLI